MSTKNPCPAVPSTEENAQGGSKENNSEATPSGSTPTSSQTSSQGLPGTVVLSASDSTQSSTNLSTPVSDPSSSKAAYMVVDETPDSLPDIMKANQLTSLVHRNIPPQEQQQQHFHRSALLKTILASGNGGHSHQTNINGETKFEMNFSNGKLGLASTILGNGTNNSQTYGNNNNTISINNNSSGSTTINNNNAPLDLSIDAAIKEVVSKDDKELTGSAKTLHYPHHHHYLDRGGVGGGLEVPRRLNANQPVTPLRFPSATNILASNNNNKDSSGEKTNFACFKRGEETQPSPLSAGSAAGHPTPAGSPVHAATHPLLPLHPSTTTATTIAPQPSSVNLLPRSNIPPSQLQQQRLSSDVATSSSLSSLASFHQDVQAKTSMEGSRDQATVAAAAAAQKRQRGSKLSDHGRVRRKRQTLQEMARPLKEWMETHLDNPYPSKQEKQSLAKASNMTMVQVANWFANARRRLKIAEKRTGGDLAAKLAAISQSDHQMDMEEEMEEADGTLSEGEGELTIDLGKSTNMHPQQRDFLDARYVPTTMLEQQQSESGAVVNEDNSEEDRHHLAQQRNNGNNSILQRYLNELPDTEAETKAAASDDIANRQNNNSQNNDDSIAEKQNKTESAPQPLREIPLAYSTLKLSNASAESGAKWATTTTTITDLNSPPQPNFFNANQQKGNATAPLLANVSQHKKYATETPAANGNSTTLSMVGAPTTSSQYQHRRSPGMGSVSSHDFEDCGQASSETSSTSGPLDWTFNGSATGESGLQCRSSPSPQKSGNDMFDDNLSLHDIEIDAALALVALSRMRQNEKLQRQMAVTTSHARKADEDGVTTLSFANKTDSSHGATIRVRQKH